MPKIIEDAEITILSEARRQLMSLGAKKMTIRSVAGACNIAAGTIYNYYPNKDILIASVILQDWKVCIKKMDCGCQAASNIPEGLASVYNELLSFLNLYSSIFNDANLLVIPKHTYNDKHNLLCTQISNIIGKLYAKYKLPQEKDMLLFLSECLLNGAVKGTDFSFLKNIFIKLI